MKKLRDASGRVKPYIEIPSSLIMYPIPYPSAATGPNPNNLKAGFPQFEVLKIEVLKSPYPWSVKILGSLGLDPVCL